MCINSTNFSHHTTYPFVLRLFLSHFTEKCDPYKIPVDYVFRSNVLALEDVVRNPETQIGGLVVLLDMAGLGFAHARLA